MTERRFFGGDIEQREKEGKIFGYAAVFDSESQVMFERGVGEFVETIDKRAFDEVLKSEDIMILANHDKNMVLGRTGAGTAKIGVDERGLWYEVKPPVSRADILESVERRDMIGSSFGFDVGEEEWTDGEAMARRHIRSFSKVWDLGPVSYPAYLDTTTAFRNYSNFLKTSQERNGSSSMSERKMKLFFYENQIII